MKMSLYKEGKHKTVITFDCRRSVDKQVLHNYWAKEKRWNEKYDWKWSYVLLL